MEPKKTSNLGFSHFTSDPHYVHKNIIEYCNRPFRDVEHQIEELVARFNAIVTPEDHTLILGDLFLGSRGVEIMGRLNGKKTLVAGNHDLRVTTTKLLSFGFEAVHRGSLYDVIDGMKVCYNHFPHAKGSPDERYLNLRPPYEEDVVLMHGHTHSRERFNPRQLTVHPGVDAWDYSPCTLEQISSLIKHCHEQRVCYKAMNAMPD